MGKHEARLTMLPCRCLMVLNIRYSSAAELFVLDQHMALSIFAVLEVRASEVIKDGPAAICLSVVAAISPRIRIGWSLMAHSLGNPDVEVSDKVTAPSSIASGVAAAVSRT